MGVQGRAAGRESGVCPSWSRPTRRRSARKAASGRLRSSRWWGAGGPTSGALDGRGGAPRNQRILEPRPNNPRQSSRSNGSISRRGARELLGIYEKKLRLEPGPAAKEAGDPLQGGLDL